MTRLVALLLFLVVLTAACSSDDATDIVAAEDTSHATTPSAETASSTDEEQDSATATEPVAEAGAAGSIDSFTIEVWADNWMAVYVDGALVGEDSVSITTERSFNSETFSFEASYPFTLAIEAKDFRETDSGLEYIGSNRQQMGDGGIIAQVTDSSGALVAVTNSQWSALIVHRAPLNTDCEKDSDPNTTCQFEISETPADWTSATFDSSDWPNATVWSAADVDPKQGYDDISWDDTAELIWGTDLEVDNTVLLRTIVAG